MWIIGTCLGLTLFWLLSLVLDLFNSTPSCVWQCTLVSDLVMQLHNPLSRTFGFVSRHLLMAVLELSLALSCLAAFVCGNDFTLFSGFIYYTCADIHGLLIWVPIDFCEILILYIVKLELVSLYSFPLRLSSSRLRHSKLKRGISWK